MTDFIPMPESVSYHNANNQRCDMLRGPCACGAWHDLSEWTERMIGGRSVMRWPEVRAAIGRASATPPKRP